MCRDSSVTGNLYLMCANCQVCMCELGSGMGDVKRRIVEVVLVKKSEDESIILLIIHRPNVAQVFSLENTYYSSFYKYN